MTDFPTTALALALPAGFQSLGIGMAMGAIQLVFICLIGECGFFEIQILEWTSGCNVHLSHRGRADRLKLLMKPEFFLAAVKLRLVSEKFRVNCSI